MQKSDLQRRKLGNHHSYVPRVLCASIVNLSTSWHFMKIQITYKICKTNTEAKCPICNVIKLIKLQKSSLNYHTSNVDHSRHLLFHIHTHVYTFTQVNINQKPSLFL